MSIRLTPASARTPARFRRRAWREGGRYLLSVALGAAALTSMGSAPLSPPRFASQTALADFHMGIHEYLATRAHALRDVPPAPRGASFAEIAAAYERQFRAVRRARADASAGDVFTESVSDLFRRTIAFTLDEYNVDVKALRRGLQAEVPRGAAEPRVNEGFPWVRGGAMPIVLIDALPSLPAELQYRLVDRDLVLLDVSLGLVVDILPKALPKG